MNIRGHRFGEIVAARNKLTHDALDHCATYVRDLKF